jgi:hypothetical protein
MPRRCLKYRYQDRIGALLALASAQRKDGARRAKIESRAYRCEICHGWHLTSRPYHPRVRS